MDEKLENGWVLVGMTYIELLDGWDTFRMRMVKSDETRTVSTWIRFNGSFSEGSTDSMAAPELFAGEPPPAEA